MASNERVALDAGDSSSCDFTASVWPHLALYFSILAGRGRANRAVTFSVMYISILSICSILSYIAVYVV